MPPLTKVLEQLKMHWGGMSVRQRAFLVGGSILTIAILIIFTTLIARPDYKPLFTGMESADVQALTSKLASKNIQYEVSPDGKTVSVPADKLDSSRIELASEGLPKSGRLGFELFDKVNWGQTEFEEKVNYQRALEGELEKTIGTLKGVESVRVHLVMPADSVFIDRERAAKASVTLRLRSGTLSQDTYQAIARLVSGAVDKLSPENVTVIDADTNLPLGQPKRGVLSDGETEQELAHRVIRTLEPVVGSDSVRASISVEYDPSTSEENQESYDPKNVVAVSTQHSEESNGATALGGIPGTATNVPGASGGTKSASTAGESQSSRTDTNSYVVNKLVRHVIQPAGRVRRITAAVVVDDALETKSANGTRTSEWKKRTPDEMKQIEELARAAIGIDSSRGDAISIQNLSFQHRPNTESPSIPAIQRLRITLNDWSSLVRYAALLLLFFVVYLTLLRPIKRQVLAAFRSAPLITPTDAKLQLEAQEDLILSSQPEDQRRASALRKEIVKRVKTDPVPPSRLVESWLREDQQ